MSRWAVLFSYQGRLGRGPYWRITSQLNWSFLLVFPTYIGLTIALLNWLENTASFEVIRVGLMALAACLCIAFAWIFTAMATKRCHDCGHWGWWQVLVVVPLGGIVFFCLIGAQRGTAQANQFGPPPSG